MRIISPAAFMAALIAGCGSPSTPASTPASAPGAAAEPATGGGGAVLAVAPERPRARSVLDVLPRRASLAVGMDLMQLRTSPLYATLAPVLTRGELGRELARYKEECGIDALAAVHSLYLGADMTQQKTVVVSGLGRAELARCLERLGRAEETQVAVADHGALMRVRREDRVEWMGWMDASTLVVSTPKSERAVMEQRLAGRDGLTQNPAMMELIGQVSTQASLWVVSTLEPGGSALASFTVHSLYLAVDVTSGLEVRGALRMDSADEAQSMVTAVAQQLGMLQGNPLAKHFRELELTARDREVLIDWRLDHAGVAELAEQLTEVMPLLAPGGP